MVASFFSVVYVAVFTYLLLQAFMMRPSFASEACALNDRTGLMTTHPELLDENGEMTQEELWAVRFSDEGVVMTEA